MRCECGTESPPDQTLCSHCGRTIGNRSNRRRLFFDGAVGAALLLALGAVFAVDRGCGSARVVELDESVETAGEDGEADRQGRRTLRLAVTPPQYDDVGRLLREELGSGYQYKAIHLTDLLYYRQIEPYDVVFLTCADLPPSWDAEMGDERRGPISQTRATDADGPVVRRLRASLRQYVRGGGTLYVSDLHLRVLAFVFPEVIDWSKFGWGADQAVDAEVLDTELRARLGASIRLHFDKVTWRPAAIKSDNATVYLRGSYHTLEGHRQTGPLLVKVPVGDGAIIFTSFHNEKQLGATEVELLKHLVAATVTARVESKVRKTMISGGFSPVQGNLLSASSGSQSVTRTYRCRSEGTLQFVLGFEGRDARLRLEITGPDGRHFEETGTTTFTVEVPRAKEGSWQYTITALEVPYENFSFTLTVGEEE